MKKGRILMRLVKFFVLFPILSSIAPAKTAKTFSYETNAFYGWDQCIAIADTNTFRKDEKVLAFTGAVRETQITEIVPTKTHQEKFQKLGYAKLQNIPELWKEMYCYWEFKRSAVEPPFIAKTSHPADIVIKDLPATANVVSGFRELLPKEIASLLEPFKKKISPACLGEASLFRGYQHGEGSERLLRLSVGLPKYKNQAEKQMIAEVKICSLFIHKGKLLELSEISRSSSEPEHVDMDPPELTPTTWDVMDKTILAFVSLDGKKWEVFTKDVGFEGVAYAIRTLGAKEPLWSKYHSTPH